jgi:repressor of nif and glnA expression
MAAKSDRIKLAILKALSEIGGEAGASRLTSKLAAIGMAAQPRTVRFYLLQLDEEGLTQFVSRRRGRIITEKGREELEHANVLDKVGFVAAKIDVLGYRMSFNVHSGVGSVIVNTAWIRAKDLDRALLNMAPVFEAKLGMGNRMAIAREGQMLAGRPVPRGQAALATVCSVTVNGILLKEGVPVTSRFGGLVEMRGGRAVRFVNLIEYRGTTVDPLEIFMRAGLTQVQNCARNGTGLFCASFREIPGVAAGQVRRVQSIMESRGLAGILYIGEPNRPLLDIPVAEGQAGMVVIGGLNPFASLHEAGIPLKIESLCGFEDFTSFAPFDDVAMIAKRRIGFIE